MGEDVPETFSRLIVHQLDRNFRKACSVEEVDTPTLGPFDLLVKNHFVGVNASDANFSAGRYDPTMKPPFACGFEGVGEIVKKGKSASMSIGQAVAYMCYGAYSEYHVVHENIAIPIPECKKEYCTMLISGMAAGIALEVTAKMKKGETVLVTAAAGGTGQMACQIAKLGGCHVIGTCSSAAKVERLKELGCDRVINYNEEDLGEVLQKEYPKGVDIVYDCVSGEVMDTCVNNLALHGRLIVIGYISSYVSGPVMRQSMTLSTLPHILLSKNASIRGFFIGANIQHAKATATKLLGLYHDGKLKCFTDNGDDAEEGPFVGLEGVYDAIDYVYTKQSIGKVIVELPTGSGGCCPLVF